MRFLSVHLEGDSGYIPTLPEKTLELGYGDCKDVVALFIALAKASGIEAEFSLVNATEGYHVDEAPLPQRFNHVLAYLPAFKSFVDLATPTFPVGELALSLKDKKAFVLHEGGKGELMDTPSVNSVTCVEERQNLRWDGTLEGEGAVILTSHAAAGGRGLLKADATPYEFYELMSGIPGPGQITVASGTELEAPELVLKTEGLFPHFTPDLQEQKVTKVSVGAMVDPLKEGGFFDLLHHPDRAFPLLFPRSHASVEVVFSLPEGYVFTEIPDPIDLQNSAGRFSASFTPNLQEESQTGTLRTEIVLEGPLFEGKRIDDFLALASAYLASSRMVVGVRKLDEFQSKQGGDDL